MYTVKQWGGEFQLKKATKPCSICGKPTCWVNIYTRERICSKTCAIEEERELQECESLYSLKIFNSLHDI